MSLETPTPGEPSLSEALPPPRAARRCWRHQDFLKVWSAQTISRFGDEITQLALPLVAILTLPVLFAPVRSLQSIPDAEAA